MLLRGNPLKGTAASAAGRLGAALVIMRVFTAVNTQESVRGAFCAAQCERGCWYALRFAHGPAGSRRSQRERGRWYALRFAHGPAGSRRSQRRLAAGASVYGRKHSGGGPRCLLRLLQGMLEHLQAFSVPLDRKTEGIDRSRQYDPGGGAQGAATEGLPYNVAKELLLITAIVSRQRRTSGTRSDCW